MESKGTRKIFHAGRAECSAPLRNCERILAGFGMTEERGRVAAALKQLGEAS